MSLLYVVLKVMDKVSAGLGLRINASKDYGLPWACKGGWN
jgi:hypothetical protein